MDPYSLSVRGNTVKQAHEIMTLLEVCDWLRVHPSTVHRLLKRHEIPSFKVGGKWRFDSKSIDAWIAQRNIWTKPTGTAKIRRRRTKNN
jgi:excisionase family DNA binding protein